MTETLEKSRKTLGVGQDATLSDIKRAYRVQVRIWHPDLFHDNLQLRKAAEEKIKEINEARRVLCSQIRNGLNEYEERVKGGAGHSSSSGVQAGPIPTRNAPTLINCNACGQLNGIDKLAGPRLFLCCRCGRPLIELARPRELPKTFHSGLRGWLSPDFFKFLLFCACSLSVLTITGIGALFILWKASVAALKILLS